MKYTYVMDAETFRASQLKEDMEKSGYVSHRENEDNNTMTLIISPPHPEDINYLDPEVIYNISAELQQNPQKQKEYYEELGFTCEISRL